MKKKLYLAIASVSIFVSTFAFADDAMLLRQELNDLSSIKANFNQTVTDVNKRIIQKGQGELALASPNKLYWHLTSPDESLIVADGNDVWLYNPFAEEVTAMNMKNVIKASPIALLIHKDEQTWRKYNVNKHNGCFVISPKIKDPQITAVNVCFSNKKLSQLAIEDNQGNYSEFLLSKQQSLNVNDNHLFKFIVPKGVELDDQRVE